MPIEEIQAKNYDLKAVNPNRKMEEDTRTPEELLSIIEAQEKEILNIITMLNMGFIQSPEEAEELLRMNGLIKGSLSNEWWARHLEESRAIRIAKTMQRK